LYHLVNELLRNKDINEKCELDILKVYFKRILLYPIEQKPKKTKKRTANLSHRNVIFESILNKTRNDRIRNTNKRLELGMDGIKNEIQKMVWTFYVDR
jgi:hypothetical protein